MNLSPAAPSDAQAVRVPEVFHYGPLPGRGQHGSFICMEYLQLGGKYAQADLGRRMAQMHLAAPKVMLTDTAGLVEGGDSAIRPSIAPALTLHAGP